MIFQEPLNWFYTDMPVRMPGEADRYAYQLVPGQDPRPGNFEDELVNDFLALTNQPEWVGDNVEGLLRIALRRAADAAVRTTLDAEKPASVVYETAEERAAKQTLAAKQALRELEAKRAGPFSNGIWTPPVAISDIKKDLIDAEDRGEGVVNLILGYAAVAIIERLEWQASQIERIADALEAKAVRP